MRRAWISSDSEAGPTVATILVLRMTARALYIVCMWFALVLAAAMGTVTIAAEPEAEVVVDGKAIAKTPLKEHPVSAGAHTIRVRSGKTSVDFTLTVRADRNSSASVDMATGRVEIVLDGSAPLPEATPMEISAIPDVK